MNKDKSLLLAEIENYVADNIGQFHSRRLESLKTLKLSTVLKRKNPYLFRAKNALTAQDIVKSIVDAHISSNEETIFGEWLERLAIFISERCDQGRKSACHGIDLEFDRGGVRYLVSIKSGPNWGNSSQVAKMVENFNTAERVLRTSGGGVKVEKVNGCCYGVDNSPIKKQGYIKLCGQRFWELLSGDSKLYIKLIEPIGKDAQSKNDEYLSNYVKKINALTAQFLQDFATEDGSIDWGKIIEVNSKASM